MFFLTGCEPRFDMKIYPVLVWIADPALAVGVLIRLIFIFMVAVHFPILSNGVSRKRPGTILFTYPSKAGSGG